MAEKGDLHREYDIHGEGTDSLRAGFDALNMPTGRRAKAVEIVEALIATNRATGFRWYKPPGTNELACYWDGAHKNQVWITNVDVHIQTGSDVAPPSDLNYTWEKQEGAYRGWLLPGAVQTDGGGSAPAAVKDVLCPVTFIRQPAGTECPDCVMVH